MGGGLRVWGWVKSVGNNQSERWWFSETSHQHKKFHRNLCNENIKFTGLLQMLLLGGNCKTSRIKTVYIPKMFKWQHCWYMFQLGGKRRRRGKLSVHAFIGVSRRHGYTHVEWQHSCAGTSFQFGSSYLSFCFTYNQQSLAFFRL